MSDTIFKKVDYTLNTLVSYIELGMIGLPDIQRPFVWKNSKVRDLFDSMYRGYPVGYLLFWQNGLESSRTIGVGEKQKTPSLVIVDGQQRLTSLYAVIKGVSVVRENYEAENIHIAFNPIEEKFEVADAAIRRDKSFIPDISCVWGIDTNIFKVAEEYLTNLRTSREINSQETQSIQNAITKLQALLSFPFTALELAAHISEESVSDVFVRINSKGVTLSQANFILTLMSVFWDEGRDKLEQFCRQTRKPTKNTSSSFNYFIEPDPDQLLRVCVGVAFKRARLKYVYSILRGKDLETGEFSEKRRIEQFGLLKDAQTRVLNIQYWHDFLNCIRSAGFRSKKMISSNNNLLFSYILYLIGRTEYKVEERILRKVIARWFFMSAVTGRFTGSPETAMEFDLARFRGVTNPAEFVGKIQHVCDITLTNDFWQMTLPNDLATSSPRSPSLFAFNASLVLLDAPVLFSKTKISEHLDPAVQANRSMIERHHLFPKGYLKTLKITSTRDTNQIANYAFVEWMDNLKISDQSPADYLPELKKRFSAPELSHMYRYHAMPENWEQMKYEEFLQKRRDLMANVIREGYEILSKDSEIVSTEEVFDVTTIIDSGETEAIEFKSTLRTNLHTGRVDKQMEAAVLKTLAGFLNTNGGTLIIGLTDDGVLVGIAADKFASEDKMSLHLVNIGNQHMGPEAMTSIHQHFEDYDESRVLAVRCERASAPVYVKHGDTEKFYIRTGPATTELSPSQIQSYIEQRWKK